MRRILTILMLVAVSAAAAQERFDHIFRRNPWNGGLNAAGIRQDSLSRSYAEIYFTKEIGWLAGHSAADDSWNAGAKTESVRHLKKVSFSGGFGYDYFDGRISYDQAVELIKRNSRRYAKRQLTWFRRDAEIRWFGPDQTGAIINYIDFGES